MVMDMYAVPKGEPPERAVKKKKKKNNEEKGYGPLTVYGIVPMDLKFHHEWCFTKYKRIPGSAAS